MPVPPPSSVLLVTPRWARNGGVATHVQASAKALIAHGIEVGVAAADIESEQDPSGVRLHRSARLFDRSASPAQRLSDVLSGAPEVIHLHQVEDPEIVSFARERAPVVMSVHSYVGCTSGVHYFRPGQECTRAHGPGCWPNLIARGCAHTRHPTTLPPSYRRATRALEALGLSDLAVCYSRAVDRHLSVNGVARRKVVPLFSTMTPRHGSGHAERRRVVFAGRVVGPKGVDVLLQAARSVQAEFVICGDGWRLESMRRLAGRLGVAQRVEFKGWLDAEQTAQELADASVVVLPSLWPEPFGLVGIEALAAGRPVIATATGGIGDWLADGVNGLLVKPGDATGLAHALEQLLSDPERQRAMGLAGQAMVRARFSAERHVQELVQAYAAARSHWQSGCSEPADGALR